VLDAFLLDPLLLLKLLGVGLLAGAASGMLGIGGGIVMVPALVLLTPLDFRQAVAASLLVMVVATPLGLLRHNKAGNVRLRQGLLLGAAGFVGVLLGAWLDRFLTQANLMQLFALLLVISARQLVYGRPPQTQVRRVWPVIAFGVAAGLVAKLLGVGGGIIMVPGLVFLGLGMHTAVGTSLVAVWTNASLSTALNLFDGASWWVFAVPLAVGSLLGIRAGAARALRTHADPLRRVFGLLMVYTALALVSRSLA
jgi:uncharacterized membrane protein YfcA